MHWVLLALFLSSTPAAAVTSGPNYPTTQPACSFQFCSASLGEENGGCSYSSGAAQTIQLTGFGFALPSTATINGIIVESKTSHDSCDGDVRLLKAGTPVGSASPLGGPVTTECASTSYVARGNAFFLWGSPWTPADINDSGFGIEIRNNGCTAVGVDAVRVIVHYTVPDICGDGYTTESEACDDGNTTREDGCSAECQTEVALTSAQQKCVNTLNKGGAKISKTVVKVALECMKDSATPQEFLDCANAVLAEGTPTDKAFTKLQKLEDKHCAAPAPFGPPSAQNLLEPVVVVTAQVLTGLIPVEQIADQPDAACRRSVMKAVYKLLGTRLGLFNACKKAGIAGKDGEQMLSGADLEACLTSLPDDAGKIAKQEAKILQTLQKKCEAASDDAFPGNCAGQATPESLSQCMAERTACTWCAWTNVADGISADCDLADNGIDDGSCTF